MKSVFRLWFVVGLCLALLWGCFGGGSTPRVDSIEQAETVLLNEVLPGLSLDEDFVSDQVASRYATDAIAEPLPSIDEFPLYAATPSTSDTVVYLELYSSSEKANVDKQNERWLVEVAESFNAQGITTESGKTIQVGVRQVPSGTAARLLAEGAVQPAGYSPSNDLWIEMIKTAGVEVVPVVPQLVPNTAGFVLQKAAYDQLGGAVTFDQVVDAMISGQLAAGYPNPYTSSTSLNLLYHLFWRAAGHQTDNQPLTLADLESPEVNSVFSAFQDQVLITTTTTLDLQELFIREPDKLQAFPLEYQNYQALIELPGFESVQFVPFGIPHTNPLVGFGWNDADQREALQRFGAFATSPDNQQLAASQGFEPVAANQAVTPPIPNGEVLLAAQTYWKARKDGGRTVYLMTVVDTSGSM